MKKNHAIVSHFAAPLLLCIGVSIAPAAFAHGGEDHGDSHAAVPTAQALAPRTEATSDETELLAVYQDKQLTLYLSDFKTNAPIANAKIEIESGTDKVLAQADGAGRYKAAAPWLGKPGTHGLVFTIEGDNAADLLEASIAIPQATEPGQSSRIAGFAPAGLIAALGGVGLVGFLQVGLRRRAKHK